MTKSLGERIGEYATRYWLRHNMEKWPTVRETCHALKIRNIDVEDYAGDGHYMTTTFHAVIEEPFGSHFIEADNKQVEQAWCGYWLEYSSCKCGAHV